jgi:hypothetical protein
MSHTGQGQDRWIEPWGEPGWLPGLIAWAERQLAKHGLELAGKITQPHVRPWSTVLRLPTDRGAVFLKAGAPSQVHEARLMSWMVARWPDSLPPLLAVEKVQGWLLMGDCGPVLRPQLKEDRDLSHWERILSQYAQLQIDSVESSEALLALGVPDRRPSRLEAGLAKIVNVEANLPAEVPRIADETLAELGRRQDDLRHHLADLQAAPIPPALNHGDFHDANIAYDGQRYKFFDWGDASVSQPFFSLRTVFVSVENSLGLNWTDPACLRLRDAYLEPWSKLAPPAELRRIVGLAAKCWALGSMLGWHRALKRLAPAERIEYQAIPSLAQELVDSLAGRDWAGLDVPA